MYTSLWSTQHTLDCVSRTLNKPLQTRQIFWRALFAEEQFSRGKPDIFEEGEDCSSSLVGISSCQNSLLNPLPDNRLQPGSNTFNSGTIELLTHNRILIA